MRIIKLSTDEGEVIEIGFTFASSAPYVRGLEHAIETGHLQAELRRGWEVGEERRLTGTVFGTRVF